MLFKPDSDAVSDGAPSFDANEALEEAYETVNEGETTDTTSGLDTEGLLDARKQSASSSSAGQTANASWKDASKEARLQEGGIKSSSDSEAEESGGSKTASAPDREEAVNAQGDGGAQQEGKAAS